MNEEGMWSMRRVDDPMVDIALEVKIRMQSPSQLKYPHHGRLFLDPFVRSSGSHAGMSLFASTSERKHSVADAVPLSFHNHHQPLSCRNSAV